MARIAITDSLNNHFSTSLLNADMTKYSDAVRDANSLWNYGWASTGSDGAGNWYNWLCGTQYSGRSAYNAWMQIMKDYAPFDGLFPLGTDKMDGFNVKQLIAYNMYTVGVTKKFYLSEDHLTWIQIYADNETTNGWNHKIYAKATVTVCINGGTPVQMFSTSSGTIRDFGLVAGVFNNVQGYYFYYIEEFSNSGNQNIILHQNVNTSIAYNIKNSAGVLHNPIEVDPSKEPIGGWGGDNDPIGDTIDLPDEPDETISGALASGFLNVYAPSASNLHDFGGALWTNAFNVKWYDLDSVSNLILNTISDPINFIIGLFMLPVSPTTSGSSGIYLGGINVNTVSAPKVSKQFKKISFGSLDISELYGNYLDYSNSRLSIYLPYIGTADLDVQEVNGGSVELEYTIDCFTGACVANVLCSKSTETPWGKTYTNTTVHSYSGNVAIQLPISAGSFDTMTQGLINIGLGLGTNAPAVAMQGATGVLNGMGGDATTRGALSSNTGKLSYQTPYLMFTRPIESYPKNTPKLHGIGAGVGGTLSAFSGYVECSDVKLDGVTATDKELDMIKSLLETGVYV